MIAMTPTTASTFQHPDPNHTPNDVRFYYRHARRSQHPVLEIGNSGGRYCLPLAEQEIPVCVLDEDQEYLAELRAFAEQHEYPVTTQAASLESFEVEPTFGMIYLPAGCFTDVVTFDAQLALLRRLRAHLPIGGKFAFDVPLPSIADMALNLKAGGQALTMREMHKDEDNGGTVYVWERLHYDTVEQVETRHEVHERVDSSGASLNRAHSVRRQAYFWPRQVRALLMAAGYMIEAVYGGFNDEPLTEQSRVQVWLARRPID